ncbi:DNA-directed RNA polymerase III subunit RPC9 isoform X3 [Crotalus tigris]|uniref:DNA-directed RNA polymerase III subunit RPC9 isoform X3 n=1 Tax=Crotalus tigris TaxID=88082 RepID=UPI00192F808B|nr:DNA-directed RNA polymerase III subunit RPC9 isoform X3 [Crotalus tigris]
MRTPSQHIFRRGSLFSSTQPVHCKDNIRAYGSLWKRKDGNAALLSNYEVYKLLTDLKRQCQEPGKSKQSVGQQNLNTITYETLKYISKTPCKFQSPEIVRDFLIALKNQKLTKHFLLESRSKRQFPAKKSYKL